STTKCNVVQNTLKPVPPSLLTAQQKPRVKARTSTRGRMGRTTLSSVSTVGTRLGQDAVGGRHLVVAPVADQLGIVELTADAVHGGECLAGSRPLVQALAATR